MFQRYEIAPQMREYDDIDLQWTPDTMFLQEVNHRGLIINIFQNWRGSVNRVQTLRHVNREDRGESQSGDIYKMSDGAFGGSVLSVSETYMLRQSKAQGFIDGEIHGS